MTDFYPFKKSLYNKDLSCSIYEISYDFKQKLGSIRFATNSYCNMTACINLFKQIDTDIIQIQTHAGEKQDIIYTLRDDEWSAGYLIADSNNPSS